MDGGHITIIMTEDNITHDDKIRHNTELLNKKLDHISIKHIKELGERIRRVDMPKP